MNYNLIPDFINEQEEKTILALIGQKPRLHKSSRNSIQRFGSKTPYGYGVVSEIIPEFLENLCLKLVAKNLLSQKPDSVTINEYHPGQSILPHFDNKNSGEVITVLSLLSEATMVFEKDKEKFSLELPSRSLIQFSGELRHDWMHSILPVRDFRYSLVFRCSVQTD